MLDNFSKNPKDLAIDYSCFPLHVPVGQERLQQSLVGHESGHVQGVGIAGLKISFGWTKKNTKKNNIPKREGSEGTPRCCLAAFVATNVWPL